MIALYALAVFLAKNARRLTLRNIGWALIAVGLLVATLRRLTGNYVTSMVSDPNQRPVVKVAYAVGSELLKTIAMVIVAWGIIFVLGCIIAGPSRFAVAVRRFVAPVLNMSIGPVIVGAVGIYLVLCCGRRSPPCRAGPRSSVWRSSGGSASGSCASGRSPSSPMPSSVSTPRVLASTPDGPGSRSPARSGSIGSGRGEGKASGGDHADQLERLVRLHDSGSISDDEFASAKAKLLA